MNNITTSILIITIFKNILNDNVIVSFINFLNAVNENHDFCEGLKLYSDFISLLYEKDVNQNFYEYLKRLIYEDENILSKGCSKCIRENNQILNTAEYELTLLNNLLEFDYTKIQNLLNEKYPEQSEIIKHLPYFYTGRNEKFILSDIINSYKKFGYGIFSCYSAFKYTEQREIKPVKYFDALTFSDLKNYEYQKSIIKQNTKAFLDGKEANNILLYGDRGCGKSSTVKALINEFNNYNLKIIQVYKESFIYLADLYEQLRNLPLKFIIFADDISFEEDDKNFSSVKAVLEGSLSDKPSNTIIYATTNRMHLVKESFTSREGNEIHYNDTIDEMVSLSDRFGIMLTFSLLTKKEYLDIVQKIADDCCVKVNDELFKKAEEFAALKSIRTPRVARQFITAYIAEL
ncbi:MAG: ATP-binding protein [Candidatus Gastranaerophilales bacterium]|nr:ATP-binding protein [Candidatus Gastranaerophilales bacterium]